MATHSTLSSLFTDIANAIRGKTGESATIVADNFPSAIASISTEKPEETFTITPKIVSQSVTPTSGSVFSSGTVNALYTEVDSASTMDSILSDNTNRDKMYKFTGTTTSSYTNGWLYICEPVTYNISATLTNVTASGSNPTTITDTATLTFTADSGYTLPDSITVTGASYTYTKSTGTVVLSAPTGNINISIVGASSSYQVTVTTAKMMLIVYDGQDSSGTPLAEVVSLDEPKTVSISSGYIYLDLGYEVTSSSGGIGAVTLTTNGLYAVVTGDGAITAKGGML